MGSVRTEQSESSAAQWSRPLGGSERSGDAGSAAGRGLRCPPNETRRTRRNVPPSAELLSVAGFAFLRFQQARFCLLHSSSRRLIRSHPLADTPAFRLAGGRAKKPRLSCRGFSQKSCEHRLSCAPLNHAHGLLYRRITDECRFPLAACFSGALDEGNA